MLNECVRYGLKLFVNECRKIKENAGHRNAMRVQAHSLGKESSKQIFTQQGRKGPLSEHVVFLQGNITKTRHKGAGGGRE